MRMSTAATLALAVLLATTTMGAVAATPSAPAPTTVERPAPGPSSLSPALEQSRSVSSSSATPSVSSSSATPPPLERPDTWQVIRIRITDTGNAKWTVESRFRVTDDADAETFNEYADAVVSGQRDVGYDPQLFERYANLASESTGRNMSIENAAWDDPRIETVQSNTDRSGDEESYRVGIISYSFTWTNFATVNDDRIYFGDAFRTESGLWIGLSDGQRLVIETQPDFALETPTQLTWNGPYEFTDDELEIVFVQTETILWSNSSWVVGFLLVLVLLIGTSGYLLTRRDGQTELPISTRWLPSVEEIGIDSWNSNKGTTTDGAKDTESARTVYSSDAEDSTTDGTVDENGTHLEFEESGDEIDPELLSDEERVHRLLKQNGGRMKQASIVSETGWSNAKVSQLLSKMDDDDEIEKLRIGRENLITLPGVDPTEVD